MTHDPDGVAGGAVAATDGRPAPKEVAAEIARLTLHADAQERAVAELEVTVTQLQAALGSRVTIERAVGMLAERFDLALPDAFELLRAGARNSRRELRGLAQEVTESRGSTPDEIVDARRRLGS